MSFTAAAPSSFPFPFPPPPPGDSDAPFAPDSGTLPSMSFDISPSVFRRFAVAWLAIVVFDTFATFPDEYRYIWKASWTSVKLFFLLNRWGSLLMQAALLFISVSAISPAICSHIYWYGAFGGIYITFVCSVIVSLRVWAVFERSRKILVLLAFLVFAQICLMIGPATQMRPTDTPAAILKQLNLPGCLTKSSGSFSSGQAAIFWVTMLAFDSIILGMTLYRSVKVTRTAGKIPILQKLVRDGVQYFAIITLSNLVSVVFTIQNIKPFLKPFHTPASLALYSLMSSRLILSLFTRKGSIHVSSNPGAALRSPRHLDRQPQSTTASHATRSSGITSEGEKVEEISLEEFGHSTSNGA